MKNMQKIGQIALLFLALAGITSCNDNNNEQAFEIKGDVMIIKRIIGDQTYYARSYYAYGNQPITEASVTLPEGGTLELAAADASKQTYMVEPIANDTTNDFSTEQPVDGRFEFSVINEGIEHTATDELTFTDLAIDSITSVEYNSGILTIEWETSSDIDNYIVRLVDENYNPIFTGTLLSNTQSTYQISLASGGNWTQAPVLGQTYFVEIQAISYDDDATSNDFYFNINEISVASKSIVWGE